MDPQQELHLLTDSVIGGSPINYSKSSCSEIAFTGPVICLSMVPRVSAKD
jgi:hypothetical protein